MTSTVNISATLVVVLATMSLLEGCYLKHERHAATDATPEPEPSPDVGSAEDARAAECTEVALTDAPMPPVAACELSFDRCRRTVTAAPIASCAQGPVGVFTGEGMLVAFDWTGDDLFSGEVYLAHVGVDGRLRNRRIVDDDHLTGRRPQVAWNDGLGVGVVTGSARLVWTGADGTPRGDPIDFTRSLNEGRTHVSARAGGFDVLVVDEGRARWSRVGMNPELPVWTTIGEEVDQGGLVENGDRQTHGAVFLRDDERQIDFFDLEAGEVRRTYESHARARSLMAEFATDDAFFSLYFADFDTGDPDTGFWLLDDTDDAPIRVSDASSPWGADITQIGETVVMALPSCERGSRQIAIHAYAPERESRLGPSRFSTTVERAWQAELVPLPNGFALLYLKSGYPSIAMDVFECCGE